MNPYNSVIRGRWVPVAALLLFLVFCSVDWAAAESLQKASFIPQWSPQAQFAGYYTAYEKGFYKNHGIDLELIAGGPDKPALDWLRKQKADFATAWLCTALQNRSHGLQLVNVAQIIQKSALMLVTRKSSGITKPADLNGRKVSLWEGDFSIQPLLFLRQYRLNVEIIPQAYTLNLFLRGGVDAASAMWYNEYHTIINAGINPDELSTIFYDEYGLNFPEDGIYTLEETLREKPEMVCAFVKASLEGWEYAFSHQDEALDIVLKYMEAAKIPANRVHQKWMLERMQDIMRPRKQGAKVGALDRSDFANVADQLFQDGLIEKFIPFDVFYRSCDADAKK